MALFLLMLLTASALASGTEYEITSITWETDGVRYAIDSAEAEAFARSEFDCAQMCQTYTHCISWAFSAKAALCLLHPVAGLPASDGIKVFVDTAPVCRHEDAANNFTLVEWERTLTSFHAEVAHICYDEKYIYPETLRCLRNGDWETISIGTCKQRIWTSGEISLGVQYPVPITPVVGWSACVNGTPHNDFNRAGNGFSMAISDGTTSNYMLHIKVNLKPTVQAQHVTFLDAKAVSFGAGSLAFNRTLLAEPSNTYDFNGSGIPYGKRVDAQFPFTLGQQFYMRIKAAEAYNWELYVDGNFYGNHSVPLSVQDTRAFYPFNEDVYIHYLDLWCL